MTTRAALGVAAVAALLTAGSGCDEDEPARRSTAPEATTMTIAARAPILGIAEPNAWRRVPPLATAREVARRIAVLGAESQRFVVDWNVAEPVAPEEGQHNYDFTEFDAMYRAGRRYGIRPLLVVLSAPAWASDLGTRPGSIAANPPAQDRLADWKAFLTEVARRYPRAIGIEVWNEPNIDTFWGQGSPVVRPDPVRYASLLRASYEAVKAVDPEMLVVGGALAPTEPSPQGDIPPEEFARAALSAGGGAYMDALSLHPYPGGGGLAQTTGLIDAVRAARDEADAGMPLWLTEVGVTTTGPNAVSETAQAKAIVAICRAAAREADIGAVYVHTLVDRPGPAASPEPGFGLATAAPGGSLQPKPAFGTVRRAFSGRHGCAAASSG